MPSSRRRRYSTAMSHQPSAFSLERQLNDHGGRLAKVETSLEALHDDFGDIKQAITAISNRLNEVPRDGTVNTKTLISSVTVAVSIIGFFWGVLTWFQGRYEDRVSALSDARTAAIDKTINQRIDQLRKDFSDHEVLDGHAATLQMHAQTDARLKRHEEAMTSMGTHLNEKIETAVDTLRREMELTVRAMVNDEAMTPVNRVANRPLTGHN